MTQFPERLSTKHLGFLFGRELGYDGHQAYELYAPDAENGTYHDLATWTRKHTWIQDFEPLADLNIMHAAEKTLTYAQRSEYLDTLDGIKLTATEDTDPVALAFLYRSAVDAKHINEQKRSVG